MIAACIRAFGDNDVVNVEELPDPQPGAGEVLIDVKAAALNHLDIWVRKGRPGPGATFPYVLGSDAAGVVAGVGSGVQGIKVGSEIVLNPGLNPVEDEWTRRGEHSESASYGILGAARPGTFAQRICVPAACVYPKPAHLTFEEAAALPLAHLTAWRMLMNRAKLKAGESVLIHGIGGGVAIAALQIAKLSNAEIFVTSSSEEKLSRANRLGANYGINYKLNSDVAAQVRAITGGRGVDVAFDTVGASTWPINFAAVRRGGRIVHCGVTTGAETTVNISALYWNHFSILGSTMGSHEDFRQLLQAVHASKLRPVIDKSFNLNDARSAIGRMEKGEQFGKIVLSPMC
jgi:NADPH:quinone reductase-like Zn-dependent oxidoreductase